MPKGKTMGADTCTSGSKENPKKSPQIPQITQIWKELLTTKSTHDTSDIFDKNRQVRLCEIALIIRDGEGNPAALQLVLGHLHRLSHLR